MVVSVDQQLVDRPPATQGSGCAPSEMNAVHPALGATESRPNCLSKSVGQIQNRDRRLGRWEIKIVLMPMTPWFYSHLIPKCIRVFQYFKWLPSLLLKIKIYVFTCFYYFPKRVVQIHTSGDHYNPQNGDLTGPEFSTMAKLTPLRCALSQDTNGPRKDRTFGRYGDATWSVLTLGDGHPT